MPQSSLVDSSMDFTSLAKMKLDAARNPEKTVDKVAEQFESIFINMMLKSMRDATQRSGLMDSQAGRMYESMFDQEVSMHLAKNGSLGLAEKIKEQIQRSHSHNLNDGNRAFSIESPNKGFRIRSDENTYSIDRKQSQYSLDKRTMTKPTGGANE